MLGLFVGVIESSFIEAYIDAVRIINDEESSKVSISSS